MPTPLPFPTENVDYIINDVCTRLNLLRAHESPILSVGLVFFAYQQQHGPVVVKVKREPSVLDIAHLPACVRTPKLLTDVRLGDLYIEVWQRISAGHIGKNPLPWVLLQVEDALTVLAKSPGDTLTPANYQLVVDNIETRLDSAASLTAPFAAGLLKQVSEAATTLAASGKRCFQHGDLNRGNLLVDPDNNLWLIDWDSAHAGPPEWDAATAAMVLLNKTCWGQFFADLRTRGVALDKKVLQAALTLKTLSAFTYVHALHNSSAATIATALVDTQHTLSAGLTTLENL